MIELLGWGFALLIILMGVMPVFITQTAANAGSTAKGFAWLLSGVALICAIGLVILVEAQATQAREAIAQAQTNIDAASSAAAQLSKDIDSVRGTTH